MKAESFQYKKLQVENLKQEFFPYKISFKAAGPGLDWEGTKTLRMMRVVPIW
ncbi:hypothetical protein [Botryobacter ruber]|uniref:hypothetical protein n=1 Tax=Botryobacter ruber TaxID=2171629 RepID=UPI0013E3B0E6|nr:hypothetical protein [Botryobacter ruber]